MTKTGRARAAAGAFTGRTETVHDIGPAAGRGATGRQSSLEFEQGERLRLLLVAAKLQDVAPQMAPVVDLGLALVLRLRVKFAQEALPFAVRKPCGKGLGFNFSKFGQTGSGAFNFPLRERSVLLCHLTCHPAKKVKNLVDGIIDQVNRRLRGEGIRKSWFPIIGIIRLKNGDGENWRRLVFFHGCHYRTEL
jgi:hypothetical protein